MVDEDEHKNQKPLQNSDIFPGIHQRFRLQFAVIHCYRRPTRDEHFDDHRTWNRKKNHCCKELNCFMIEKICPLKIWKVTYRQQRNHQNMQQLIDEKPCPFCFECLQPELCPVD